MSGIGHPLRKASSLSKLMGDCTSFGFLDLPTKAGKFRGTGKSTARKKEDRRAP